MVQSCASGSSLCAWSSDPFAQTFRFPAPSLTPSSLRLQSNGVRTSSLQLTNTLSQTVLLDGANFPATVADLSSMTVTFGPAYKPDLFQVQH